LKRDQYVALQILKANASDREARILDHIQAAVEAVPVIKLHEIFSLTGPNGTHQYLVSDGAVLSHIKW
jgi:hypothetical protein